MEIDFAFLKISMSKISFDIQIRKFNKSGFQPVWERFFISEEFKHYRAPTALTTDIPCLGSSVFSVDSSCTSSRCPGAGDR